MGNISPGDLDLIKVTDSPQEVADYILGRYMADRRAWAKARGQGDSGRGERAEAGR
jgi:hypothetical protein